MLEKAIFSKKSKCFVLRLHLRKKRWHSVQTLSLSLQWRERAKSIQLNEIEMCSFIFQKEIFTFSTVFEFMLLRLLWVSHRSHRFKLSTFLLIFKTVFRKGKKSEKRCHNSKEVNWDFFQLTKKNFPNVNFLKKLRS
jgi:hypothetical protein